MIVKEILNRIRGMELGLTGGVEWKNAVTLLIYYIPESHWPNYSQLPVVEVKQTCGSVAFVVGEEGSKGMTVREVVDAVKDLPQHVEVLALSFLPNNEQRSLRPISEIETQSDVDEVSFILGEEERD